MSPRQHASRIAWLVALGVTPALWFGWWIVAMPAHVFNGTRWLLYDQGSYLYAIECARRGEALYTGFAWQYGPLALGWFEMWARFLGNTPQALIAACAVTTGLAWAAWVVLAARVAGRWPAWLGGVLLLLPMMTTPCVLSINDGPHGAIEALLLAGAAWALWAACAQPGRRWRWGFGVTLGLLQAVRFGPHVVAGAVGVGLLALQAWRERREQPATALVRTLAWIGAGYVSVVGPLALWLAVRMPWAMLSELLWPQHMLAHYAATFRQWLPALASPAEWLRLMVPATFAIALAVAGVVRAWSRRPLATDRAAACALALPGLYFALALAGLLRSDYAVLGHAWIALPSLALLATEARWIRWAGVLAVVLVVGMEAGETRAAWRQERAWRARPLTVPNGQTLWFREREAEVFAELGALVATQPRPLPAGGQRRLAVFQGGGGVRLFFNTARVGRHWWYLAEFVRPWEQERVATELAQHELLLMVTDVPADATTVVKIWTPLRPDLADALVKRLRQPRALPGIGYLLEIAPATDGAQTAR